MQRVDDAPVVVLLATPWAAQPRQKGRSRLAGTSSLCKASDFLIRASDVDYIKQAAESCQFAGEDRELLKTWEQLGVWTVPHQSTLGLACLKKPKPLRHMGCLEKREDFILWHAWGSPSRHDQHPQWLLFDVHDAACFTAKLDHRVYTTSLKVAEQRSSWTITLSEDALAMLHAARCIDGRSCLDCFREWGVPEDQRSFVVFTSFGPVALLVAHKKWHSLGDVCRCTTELLRRPRGRKCFARGRARQSAVSHAHSR